MTIVCLVAGKAFMDRGGRTIRLIADSSYWVYIIHLPVLFVVQFLLLDTDWNLWLKFTVSSFGTLAIGMLTYIVFVRWTPIG
jgi:peptidoglycan/LPS O-acetylase OafA/YrhL